jgi:hypothetical protein
MTESHFKIILPGDFEMPRSDNRQIKKSSLKRYRRLVAGWSCFFLKGAMPIIDFLVTPCPDIWDDGRRQFWINP